MPIKWRYPSCYCHWKPSKIIKSMMSAVIFYYKAKSQNHLHSNSGRDAAAGKTPRVLVWSVLAILWRSQHMCLFSKVLWMNVVNIGAILQEWRLNCGVIFFMLDLFLQCTRNMSGLVPVRVSMHSRYVIGSQRCWLYLYITYLPCPSIRLESGWGGVRYLSLKIGKGAT